MLALFARAAARDFQDVAALRRQFSWQRLFALAAEKDAGFTPQALLEAVAAFDQLDPDDCDLPDPGYRRLRDQVHRWQHPGACQAW